MEQDTQKTPLMPKVVFALKFNAIGLILTLSVLGAGVVQDKLHWGEAMASERTVKQSLTVENAKFVPIPNELEPIDTKPASYPTAAQQKAKANCVKSRGEQYCNELFGA